MRRILTIVLCLLFCASVTLLPVGVEAASSAGKTTAKYMPNLKSLTKQEALKRLSGAGINKAAVDSRYDEYIPAGAVIEQNYPVNAPVRANFKYRITVSKGLDPKFHPEAVELCRKKGWSKDLEPYIVASIKFLAGNTVLSIEEVIERLDQNVKDIRIGNKTDKIDDFDGVYRFPDIVLNQYTFNEKVLIHEMIHALSFRPEDGKLGFADQSLPVHQLTESFTDMIATRSIPFDPDGIPVITEVEGEPVLTYEPGSQAYSLGATVLVSLQHLFGRDTLERMFFSDESQYLKEIEALNARYGEDTWQLLMDCASWLDPHGKEEDSSPYGHPSECCALYYDKILECLKTDLTLCGNDAQKLTAFSEKLTQIQPSLPLEFNNYRAKLKDIRLSVNGKYKALKLEKYIIPVITVKMPDFSLMTKGKASRWLRAYADAECLGETGAYSDTVPYGQVIRVTSSQGTMTPGRVVKPGGEYTVHWSMGPALTIGWRLVPNVLDYTNYIEGGRTEGHDITRSLQRLGFKAEYEWLEPDPGYEGIHYKIIRQSPEPGTASKPGTVIKITFVGKK